MSASTTTETLPNSVHHLLQTYSIHHTGEEEAQDVHTTSQMASLEVPSEAREIDSHRTQPWDNDEYSRRRIPHYRETSRIHPLSSRPAGRSLVEAVIVTLIFCGVNVTGVRTP